MTRTRWSPTLALVPLTLALTASAAEADFRLAGIIAPDNGPAIALIELADGEQQLVRAGDSIGDGQVVSVTDRTVRIALPDGDILLRLAQSADTRVFPSAAATPGPLMMDAESSARIVDLASRTRDLEEAQLARELATELLLNVTERIETVNGRPVAGPVEAVNAIAAELTPSTSGKIGSGKVVISLAEPAEEPFKVYYFTGTRREGATTD